MNYIRAVISLLQVIFHIAGILPVSYEIDYGGNKYAPPVVSQPMYVTKDGKPEFLIVIPDDADKCIVTAAVELKTYIEKISGAELVIADESEYQAGQSAFVLGECSLTQSIPKGSEDVTEDGFRLYSDGENMFVTGGSSRGTLYGVYTLLEEYMGVRWFTPSIEKVPENKNIVLDKQLDRTVDPSFSVRRNDCQLTNNAHRARMKMNVSFWNEAKDYGGAMTFVLWDVTLDRLVPDTLFDEHPEYFALLSDGTRSTDHVCLSNPDVLPIAIENARNAIKNCKTDAKHIHIGQKDNSNYCHCESCEKLYEKYGSVSAPTIIFTNAFADALDDDYPDFTFTFYAYGETDAPPEDLSLRCNNNVVPVLCGLHNACRSHLLTECGAVDSENTFMNLYGDNEPKIAEDFKNWVKIADRTYVYDYTINFLNSAQFFSNLETLQPTMKYMHDIGITGYVYNCGDGHEAAFNELRNYLLCKVQWDVDCDVEYHMIDFLSGYYGEDAARYIKEILDIQTAQIKATAHAFDFDWHYQSGFYTPIQILKLDRLWKKAINADITDDERFRVETANLSWEYFKANQFIGKYSFLNPLRTKENEKLYDAFLSHNVHKVTSFGVIPPKEEVNFMDRPFNWGR